MSEFINRENIQQETLDHQQNWSRKLCEPRKCTRMDDVSLRITREAPVTAMETEMATVAKAESSLETSAMRSIWADSQNCQQNIQTKQENSEKHQQLHQLLAAYEANYLQDKRSKQQLNRIRTINTVTVAGIKRYNPLTQNNSNSNNNNVEDSNKLMGELLVSGHTLYTVYFCLFVLSVSFVTLSILFYSHVTATGTPTATPTAARTSKITTTTTTTNQCCCHNATHHKAPITINPLYNDDDDTALRNILLSQQQEQLKREILSASESMIRTIIEHILQHSTLNKSNNISRDNAGNVSSNSLRNTNDMMERSDEQVALEEPKIIPNVISHYQHEKSNLRDENHDHNKSKSHSQRHFKRPSDLDRKFIKNIERRKRRDIASSPGTGIHDSFIEFFAPNQRKILEEQDLEIRKRTELKGSSVPDSDDWIYLNTYCRVPEKMITGFCQSTQEYCPPSSPGAPGPIGPKGPPGLPGLPGLPGIPGPKGNRGDVGLPGPPGVDGAIGPVGPRGPKGNSGNPGLSGLDGRDGVPGEPGLDGVPGRAGADGTPGKDGIPGHDGKDGQNGKDGKDGIQGPKGAQGPPGERGLKGIAGPRGRPGKPGTNGVPGVPGINAWKVQFHNGTYSNDLLIPPSITDTLPPFDQRTIIVEEGKTLNLSCTATGNPMPRVEWRRDDGHTIHVNGIEMSSINGEYIKFVNITRHQMAAYTCYASNGIAPVANATYIVEVQFPPMISIYRQIIYAEYGRSATLECLVEAYPEAIKYWERAYDGKILDPGDKYRIETYPDGFKTQMRLTITNLRKDDFGYYLCVARNELNATMVNFEVAPQDPNSETPFVGKEIKIYGKPPPEPACPICEVCPDPSFLQCKDSINTNFEIQPTGNYSYPGLPKRKKSCLLYAVGKPVFHKFVDENYGSWLKDAAANEMDREKTFVTNEKDHFNLYEFTSKIQYRMNDMPRKKYEISEGFQGNAHVVFNGSFYYQQYNTDVVMKMDLITMKKTSIQLPYSGITTGNKLYSTDYNYMDFNVDEIGLWVIYSTHDSNNTLVAKLNADNLRIQYNFNITLNHRKFGEMFIVCGHLYAIDSGQDKNSQIRYAVDLYNGKLLNIDLPFTNPFRKTTTVGYNPYTVELYSWDKGNALTYPIRYHEQTFAGENA